MASQKEGAVPETYIMLCGMRVPIDLNKLPRHVMIDRDIENPYWMADHTFEKRSAHIEKQQPNWHSFTDIESELEMEQVDYPFGSAKRLKLQKYRNYCKEQNIPALRQAPNYIKNYMSRKRLDRDEEQLNSKRLRLSGSQQPKALFPNQENVELHYDDDDSLKLDSSSDSQTDAEDMVVDEGPNSSVGQESDVDDEEEEEEQQV